MLNAARQRRALAASASTAAARADTAAQLASVLASSIDAIVGCDPAGTVIRWNPGAEALFGYPAREILGRPIAGLWPVDCLQAETEALQRLQRGEPAPGPRATQRRARDGRLVDVLVSAAPVRAADGRLLGTTEVLRDTTAALHDQRELRRMARLYAALRQINQTIGASHDRDGLLHQVCRILVEQGGLVMAWVGWADAATKRLLPVAQFGDQNDYLGSIAVYTDDRPEGRGPSGTAFRSGQPYISNDMLGDRATTPWRPELQRRGFAASAALPIRHDGAVCAVLSVYADRRDFFLDEEVVLLQEAVADISLALDGQVREQARRRAEQVLRDETEFSNTMLDSMPGAVYFYDATGRFLRWNRNFEAVTGYSGSEIAGMHPLDFFAAGDRALVSQRIAEVFGGGGSTVEAMLSSKAGSLTPYFFTGRRVVFKDRPCLVGVGIDITERQRAEAALREAEARFHILFEQTPVGVAVVDPDTATVIECNEQAARQLGYSRAEFTGLPVSAFDLAATPAAIAQRTALLRQTGHDQFQTRHSTRSGEVREVLVSLRTVQLLGRLVVHCVYLDITERERDAAQLRDSEARLVEAQRIAGIGSWSMDLVDGRFSGSQQTHAICGLDCAQQAVPRDMVLALVHPDDRARLRTAQRAVVAGGSRLSLELRLVLADGSEKTVHLLADLKRGADGQPLLLSGTVHDITARARLAAAQLQRERAEAADRIKSAFLATMSHELRTPLNSIIGFTGILLQGLAGPLNPEQDKQLGMVRTSARHLLALVNDVLDISKIEAGQLEMATLPFDLGQAIDKVAASIAPQARDKQLGLQLALAPDLGTMVGDERRVQQIVLNLLSNAVKFTERGQIQLRAWRSSAPATLQLQVVDSGIGIRPQDLPLLFQPFRQVDGGLARQHEGTGLGLAICQRLAGLMGGAIRVDSVWGAGSSFTLQLPLERPAAPCAPASC